MRTAIVFGLAALTLSAQGIGPGILNGFFVSAALRQYLELTPEQTTRITRLNGELWEFHGRKALRAAEVQREIQQHLRNERLDPMELGLRYVELEAIRREQEAEQKRTVEEVRKVLTPAQMTRLNALEEALKSYGTACEAVAANLLSPPGPAAPVIGQPGVPRALSSNVPVCPTSPTGLIRGGEFQFEARP